MLAFLLLLASASLTGCATSHRNRAWLDRQLLDRTGVGACGRSREVLPANVRLDDGLDEAEVVSLALCGNPALRAELTRIDAAFASLDEARRPANPQLSLMGPIGPITAVATLLVPLESLWQLPSRSEAAARDVDAVGAAVLMRALDLVRDARLLHVELGVALDRAEVRAELARIADEVARIASVRAKVGDIGPMEERLHFADARTSADALDLAQTEVAMGRARLVAALALDETRGPLRASFSTDLATVPGLGDLLGFARAARPDTRAAELAVSAAVARAGWERARIVNVGALVEAQWNQAPGPALRLGGKVELPILAWNTGGTGRADAEVRRLTAQHELTARAVTMEVTLAHARFELATRSRRRFETDVLPALDAALAAAKRGFETGDQSFLVVLDILRRVGEARLRRVDLVAEQRRALCELERAIGARLHRAARVAADARSERGGS